MQCECETPATITTKTVPYCGRCGGDVIPEPSNPPTSDEPKPENDTAPVAAAPTTEEE